MITAPDPPPPAPESAASLALLATLQLADSAFPAGLYAFSHGLETAVQERGIRTAGDLEDFLIAWLGWQVGPGDAVIVGAAQRATAAHDLVTLLAIDARCAATKLAREAREASQKSGRRLLATATLLVSPPGTLHAYNAGVERGKAPGTHAAAFGAAGAAVGVPAGVAILAELHSATTTCLGAALRLLRIDHQQTQGILRRLAPRLVTIADAAEHADWQQLRPTSPLAEICQMRHEEAQVRLFMS